MLPYSSSNYSHKIEHDGKWWYIVLHGYGWITYQNGARAEGAFCNDALHGKGKYQYADGTIYIGNMLNFDASGKGVVTFPDKRVLDGTFKKDCPIEGILTLPDLSRYRVKYDGRTEITEVRTTAGRASRPTRPARAKNGEAGKGEMGLSLPPPSPLQPPPHTAYRCDRLASPACRATDRKRPPRRTPGRWRSSRCRPRSGQRTADAPSTTTRRAEPALLGWR